MFKTRKHMNNLKNSELFHNLNSEEISKMQSLLLEMYMDIINVVEDNNLKILLGGGSALGAVRHGGFIPWDDDMDLNMPREDYRKLLDIFDEELSDKYEITAPNSKYETSDVFMKIYMKKTINRGSIEYGPEIPCGIWIDIFPIDFVPDNSFTYYFKGVLCNSILFIGSSVRMYTYRSPLMKEYTRNSFSAKVNYFLRQTLGFIFSIISFKKWYKLHDQISSSTDAGERISIPTGRKHFFGETYLFSDFFPAITTDFEGATSYLPNNYDKYLKTMYNNYMKIPPVSEREEHFVVELNLDRDNNE